ncbi:hypothetical protein, partial [Acinetobacter sp. NigerLNRRAM0016]
NPVKNLILYRFGQVFIPEYLRNLVTALSQYPFIFYAFFMLQTLKSQSCVDWLFKRTNFTTT